MVRNSVLAACTTLEMACRDALGVEDFGGRDFKRNLNEELLRQGKPAIPFGTAVWQQLSATTLKHRNAYAHAGVPLADRFPPVTHAQDAITMVRAAIHDIYTRMGKIAPAWIDHDESPGWPSSSTGMGTITLGHIDADPNDPSTVRISLVTPEGDEVTTEYLSADTADDRIYAAIEDILGKLHSPYKRVRAYRGQELIHDEPLEVRGN